MSSGERRNPGGAGTQQGLAVTWAQDTSGPWTPTGLITVVDSFFFLFVFV